MKKKIFARLLIISFIIAPVSIDFKNLFTSADTDVSYLKISEDTTWDIDGSPYIINGESVIVSEGATLTIMPGVIVKNSRTGIVVRGNLNVIGTPDQPVVFTSINDDSIGGKSVDWSNGNPQAGDWASIAVQDNGKLDMNHAVVKYGGTHYIIFQVNNNFFQAKTANALEEHTGVLLLMGKESVIKNTEISNSKYGIIVMTSSQMDFHDLSIFANSGGGLINSSIRILNAVNFWWGDDSGPYHETLNSSGQGNSVSDGVLFDPWVGKTVIDPLILKYEPILYLHPDENYQPMNVDAFVANSSLWDANGTEEDALVKEESADDPVTLDYLAKGEETKDWYLQFVRDLTDKEPDPARAKAEYDALKADGSAKTTYYAYKMEDSYTDDGGQIHEFTVLQYWYFYPFNDWKAQVGSLLKFANNHEGDWEVVMVFLDKATKEPKYVTYSSHNNNGTITSPVLQYDSVRRKWTSMEIEKQNNQVISYVALGSHANYPNNGDNGVHDTGIFSVDDITSNEGIQIESEYWVDRSIITNNTNWVEQYKGRWGVESGDIVDLGKSGPQGPYFRGASTYSMFNEPVKWAGINNVQTRIIQVPVSRLEFSTPQAILDFDSPLPVGTEIEIDRHDEVIGFGLNREDNYMYPHPWSFESTLENYTFDATITLGYDEAEIKSQGIDEKDLFVLYYNQDMDMWESTPSMINVENNQVSFKTNHFSRYTIGAKKWQDISDQIKIQKLPGGYDNKKSIKTVNVRFKNTTQEKITGNLRLIVSSYNKDGIALANNIGTTTDGLLYLETDDYYNQCSYVGELNKELPKWKMILGKMMKNKPLPRIICDQILKKNPELKDKFKYYLAPGQYGEAVPMEFSLPVKKTIKTPRGQIYIPEFLQFNFELEVMKKTN